MEAFGDIQVRGIFYPRRNLTQKYKKAVKKISKAYGANINMYIFLFIEDSYISLIKSFKIAARSCYELNAL